MKLLKYAGVIIILFVVGYVVVGLIQKKNFDQQQQSETEQHTIEVFKKYSLQYDLKFSDYESAKKYFQEKLDSNNPTSMRIYSRWNFSEKPEDAPTLSGVTHENTKENRCEYGYLNLVTKEWATREDVCVIYN